MSRDYLDTSAAAKLLAEEPESDTLTHWADSDLPDLVATHLLGTELRRFAARHGLPQAAVTALLDRVSLYDLPRSLHQEAGLLPGRELRSLDALHLAAAVRLEVSAVVTYDARLGEAATATGLTVLAPGTPNH